MRCSGFGTLGNDLFGTDLPYFVADLPVREQDLEQAKSLLAQAGKENLEVTLQTSDIVPGFVEAATLFAEQAKGAGVTVNVKKEAANAYFDTSQALHEDRLRAVVLDGLGSVGPLVRAGAALRRGLERDPLARSRSSTSSSARPRERPTRPPRPRRCGTRCSRSSTTRAATSSGRTSSIVDAAANYVKGIVPSAFFNLGGWNYRDVWLDI